MNKVQKTLRLYLVCAIFIVYSVFIPTALAQSPLVESLKGHSISIQADDVDVAKLLRGIGKQAGINIFIDDNITEAITLSMDDISLFDLFMVVMNAKKLRFIEKNNVVYIQNEADFKQGREDVVSTRLCSEYGNVSYYQPQLAELLSPEGSMTIVNRGNCLMVRDHSENIDRVAEILRELDQPMPQIHIEARIVFSSQEAKKELGIKWGYANYRDEESIPLRHTAIGAATDLSTSSIPNMTVGFIRDNLNLAIELNALQEANKLGILSAPQILVLDGKEAEIKQGKEVPYVTQSGDNLNTSFREANLSLQVTPKIQHDDYLVLDLRVTNDSVDQASIQSNEPLINKQEINTTLFLESGVTVVIGGILTQNDLDQKGSVPGISKLPLVGGLFKNSDKTDERAELMVFITPTILMMEKKKTVRNEIRIKRQQPAVASTKEVDQASASKDSKEVVVFNDTEEVTEVDDLPTKNTLIEEKSEPLQVEKLPEAIVSNEIIQEEADISQNRADKEIEIIHPHSIEKIQSNPYFRGEKRIIFPDKKKITTLHISDLYAIQLYSDKRPLSCNRLPQHSLLSEKTLYYTSRKIGEEAWTRWRLGYFETRKEAKKSLKALSKLYPNAWVVRIDEEERLADQYCTDIKKATEKESGLSDVSHLSILEQLHKIFEEAEKAMHLGFPPAVTSRNSTSVHDPAYADSRLIDR